MVLNFAPNIRPVLMLRIQMGSSMMRFLSNKKNITNLGKIWTVSLENVLYSIGRRTSTFLKFDSSGLEVLVGSLSGGE